MSKQIFLFSILALFLSLALVAGVVQAQDDNNTNNSVVVETNSITASDLGIGEQKILPDSPWYGLKKFWEGVRDAFTFNPIVKAENSLTRASQRLIEIQALVDEGKIEDADKVIAQYEKQIEKIKTRIAKLNDIHSEKAAKFLDKFAEYQLKHRLILEAVADSEVNSAGLNSAKEKALTILSEVLAKTDNEKLQARLEKAITKLEDGDLKEFKNLEVLKALEDKVPEQAKPAILKAQVNALRRLKLDIDSLPAEEKAEIIAKFLEQSRGNGERYLEALDELIANDNLPPEVIGRLPEIRQRLQTRIRNENEVEVENDNTDANDDTDDNDTDQNDDN